MLYIIIAGIVALFIVICLILSARAPQTPTARTHRADEPEITRGGYLGGAAAGFLVLAVVTLLFSMTIVSARTVGVYTEFGKEAGQKPAGIGWTAPWVTKAQEMPTSVQYLVMDNNPNDDADNGSTNVKYKGGGGGQVDATVRWTMEPGKALDLWRKYREFDRVTDQLVRAAARDSIGVVIGPYAPSDATSGAKRREITDRIVEDLSSTLRDDGIKVDSVSVTDVRLDDKTQQSIEAIIKANADIERARAEQTRATIDAQTAKIREQSGSLSPGALTRYCLELTNQWNQGANGQLPATWSCFPGDDSAGVLVNR